MSKEETNNRIQELASVNNLWKTSYKKLEADYEKLLDTNAEISNKLTQVEAERKIYFALSLKYTAILDNITSDIKDYTRKEHLYGVENGIMQSWNDK
jgi:flagellar motility protein MotE (MotC chaperone)